MAFRGRGGFDDTDSSKPEPFVIVPAITLPVPKLIVKESELVVCDVTEVLDSGIERPVKREKWSLDPADFKVLDVLEKGEIRGGEEEEDDEPPSDYCSDDELSSDYWSDNDENSEFDEDDGGSEELY